MGTVKPIVRKGLMVLTEKGSLNPARIQTASSLPHVDQKVSEVPNEPDRLLTAQEVADRISVTPKWLYDHFDQLPFGRRLADRTLRFSERGLERWLERKAS
jgi:predicted DNA-binding transcriptional regulator AlpA